MTGAYFWVAFFTIATLLECRLDARAGMPVYCARTPLPIGYV